MGMVVSAGVVSFVETRAQMSRNNRLGMVVCAGVVSVIEACEKM